MTNAGQLKRKSSLGKQFKLKLGSIYSKLDLEKQLNTIRKRRGNMPTIQIIL